MGTYADLQAASIGLLLLRVVVGLVVGGFANVALRRRPTAAGT